MSPVRDSSVIVGVVLAGGGARRMGGGVKCLHRLGGRTLLDHVIGRIGPQVDRLLIAGGVHEGAFAETGLPVISDGGAAGVGPLGGICAAMEWAAKRVPDAGWLVSVTADTPFLPLDLVPCLIAAAHASGRSAACVRSGGRLHPLIGAWRIGLLADLRRALAADELRRGHAWAERTRCATAQFAPTASGVDPFFNINRLGDLKIAERILSRASVGAGGGQDGGIDDGEDGEGNGPDNPR